MENSHALRLLTWYDGNARALPWRVRGAHPAPYHVWLSEIMLQQTVVKTVIPYFERFISRWPRIEDLAGGELEEVLKCWAGLGYYARARNLHACAGVVAGDHGGAFPRSEAELLALPGIGPYTAAAMRAIAFGEHAVVVDGNVERVIARLFALKQPLRDIKPLIREKAAALTPQKRPGDYAQAMMDLGAMVCTPKRPSCTQCPLAENCAARLQGCAEALPAKAPKKVRPRRNGIAFVVLREDGAVLLRQRPDKGLLAKMLEVPSTPWLENGLPDATGHQPVSADWQSVPDKVNHIFTHFELQMEVRRARVKQNCRLLARAIPDKCRWVPRDDLHDQALPGIMRKLLKHGLARF